MSFPYRHVLLVGATAGIGAAMADRLVQEGVKVIATGRRKDRLDAFVKKHGSDKASSIRVDLGDRKSLSQFVETVTSRHEDLDCIFLNAGMQSNINLADPAKVDLEAFHSEVGVNFTSFVDLTMKMLPFLLSKKSAVGIVM
jgi:NADP-dependent 3-hydroxy acid dehydrogenase YdfG